MSLTLGERNERENLLFPPLLVQNRKVCNTEEQKLLSGLLFPGRGKNFSFTVSARVAGSTHSVLLAMNVILMKECEEINSPTP